MCLALISMIISPFISNAPDGLFAYIQESLGSLSVPILAVVAMGMLTKRVPALGAKIVLVGGVLLYLVSQFVLSPIFVESALADAATKGITGAKELGMIKAQAYPHFLHIMGILFVVNICIMLIMGKVAPKQDEYIPKATEAIDLTPWKPAKAVGLIIVLLVLSTYFIFR